MESYDICLLWLAYCIYHNVFRAHSYCRISFLLNTEWYSIVCTCNIMFIRSSVSEHLGCFSTLWIMMLWTGVFNDLFKIELSVPLGLPSEVGCWSCGISGFSFLRNCIFLQQLFHFAFPPVVHGGFSFPASRAGGFLFPESNHPSPRPGLAAFCFLRVTILPRVQGWRLFVSWEWLS